MAGKSVAGEIRLRIQKQTAQAPAPSPSHGSSKVRVGAAARELGSARCQDSKDKAYWQQEGAEGGKTRRKGAYAGTQAACSRPAA